MKLTTLLLLAAVGAAAATKQPAAFAQQYYADGVIRLPYDNIVEPFATWFDGVNARQRISYYNGLDTYITDVKNAVMYQVNPVLGEYDCFETNSAEVAVTSFFPDLTNFTMVGKANVKDVQCDQYTLNVTIDERAESYNFYRNSETGAPVLYTWVGMDVLLGSHFDQYEVEYHTYTPGNSTFNGTEFNEPPMECGGFPGPGYSNPGLAVPATMFPEHIDRMGRHYDTFRADKGSPHSGGVRQGTFTDNTRFIHMFNRDRQSAGESLRLAVNFLADHTAQERARRAGVTSKVRRGQGKPSPAFVYEVEEGAPLPSAVNWTAKGAVPPVRDQGICGSCWSFGTSETIASANFLKTGKMVVLSAQMLMDCSWKHGNLACDGGEDFRSYDWILQQNNGTLATQASYGHYLQADGMCHASDPNLEVGATIKSYSMVKSGSEDSLASAIAGNGAVTIAIDAALRSFSFYHTGVYYDPACKNGVDDLDHQVLATGYGTTEDGEDYFIVMNSWSTHWGNRDFPGYVYMARNRDNNCGVATDASYVQIA